MAAYRRCNAVQILLVVLGYMACVRVWARAECICGQEGVIVSFTGGQQYTIGGWSDMMEDRNIM